MSGKGVELLAPAGDSECGYAAFAAGADAVYAGLKRFSARAEAANFDLPELEALVVHAHTIAPRRRVFVTLNTLVLQCEVPALVEALLALEAAGVDALIVQDLGVLGIVRRFLPAMELHASTQLAVHNRAGIAALAGMGVKRVTLARELSLAEIEAMAAENSAELEVFIHGALCYSYSGLCLYSSHLFGRSGNRGRCAYPCRSLHRLKLEGGDEQTLLPFSMKDLALTDDVCRLRDAGVACLKIEGRKKNAYYVSAVTAFYRELLDGRLSAADQRECEQDLRTLFSRPWTKLALRSPRRSGVIDPRWTGHRGARAGQVAGIHRPRGAGARIRFQCERALQLHDGLQIDLPDSPYPFGFAVQRLWLRRGERSARAVRAEAGSWVEVELPSNYPHIPQSAIIHCSSSQSVKQRCAAGRPAGKPVRLRKSVSFALRVEAQCVTVTAQADGTLAEVRRPYAAAPAGNITATPRAAEAAFSKLGNTPFSLGTLEIANPADLFLPVSLLNDLRREVCECLVRRMEARRAERAEKIAAAVEAPRGGGWPSQAGSEGPRWSIKIDSPEYLDAFEVDDWASLDEVVVELGRHPPDALAARLEQWSVPVRGALPIVARTGECDRLAAAAAELRSAGVERFQVSSIYGLELLSALGPAHVTADWPLYVLNFSAAEQLLARGLQGFTLSPEDTRENVVALLARYGRQAAVVMYQTTPLFISEWCVYAAVNGCPGRGRETCTFSSAEAANDAAGDLRIIHRDCRNFLFSDRPYCLNRWQADLLQAGARTLRADFMLRPHTPGEVRDIFRRLRSGDPFQESHGGNFLRGLT